MGDLKKSLLNNDVVFECRDGTLFDQEGDRVNLRFAYNYKFQADYVKCALGCFVGGVSDVVHSAGEVLKQTSDKANLYLRNCDSMVFIIIFRQL